MESEWSRRFLCLCTILTLCQLLIAKNVVLPGINGDISIFNGHKIGLITNPTGVAGNYTSTIDLMFAEKNRFQLVSLFSPEHGLRGDMPPGQHTSSYIDPITGLPVYSLYGKSYAPSPEQLANISMIVFDLQDVGVRCFTYMSTMAYSLAATAKQNIPFVIIDRVNPIGAAESSINGAVLNLDFKSFIGIWNIPLRHGMTMGELGLMFNKEMGINHPQLSILKVQGDYSERLPSDNYLDTAWLLPSPNLPSLDIAFLYPGTVLFESFRNVSLGRGTTTPFQVLGAPFINNYELLDYIHTKLVYKSPELRAYLQGVKLIPAFWIPSTDVHQGVQCSGIRILITDRSQLNSIGLSMVLMRALLDIYPGSQLDLRASELNIRMGYDAYSQFISNTPIPTIVQKWKPELENFKQRRSNYLLY